MFGFTEYYLHQIMEAQIRRLVEKGKWMTQEEVERMHLVSYRNGSFIVRHRDKRGPGWRWFVSWNGAINGKRVRVAKEAGRAVTAFETVRREVERLHLVVGKVNE
jgi:hypothetical protein